MVPCDGWRRLDLHWCPRRGYIDPSGLPGHWYSETDTWGIADIAVSQLVVVYPVILPTPYLSCTIQRHFQHHFTGAAMPGAKPNLHVTVATEESKLKQVAVAWRQAKGHFYGTANENIPAGSKITVFIDKPQEPEKGKRKVKQAATAEA
jgi:hypothetical protein